MLADVSMGRMNSAVQLCLHRCYRADNPLAAMAEYTTSLRRLGWSKTEIEQLETVVRRILRQVSGSKKATK
jgi:hypothetical protein